jgi:hypothetical protein
MSWERAAGLCLAAFLLVIWSVYCRRLALAERRAAGDPAQVRETAPQTERIHDSGVAWAASRPPLRGHRSAGT